MNKNVTNARYPYERGKIKIVNKANPNISRRDNKITFFSFKAKDLISHVTHILL